MEILEAFDLTDSYRAAAALTGCDHKAVQRYVRERDRGRGPGETAQRRKRIDPFLAQLEEWIERSRGWLRADPGSFDTIFPKGLATAAVDRLLHHAPSLSPRASRRGSRTTSTTRVSGRSWHRPLANPLAEPVVRPGTPARTGPISCQRPLA